MKVRRLGMVLLLAASIALTPSCKKKSEDPQPEEETPVTPGVGSFTAKVNGTATNFVTNFYTESSGMGGVTGTDATGKISITLAIYNIKKGTFKIDGGFYQGLYFQDGVQHQAASGSITISKYENNTISGTFNFEETGGVKVTEGVFTDVVKK